MSLFLKSKDTASPSFFLSGDLTLYSLPNENKVTANFKVVNKTKDKTMIFGLGGHPAFKCELL